MDRPGQRSYEVIQLILELWERKKGEQAAMLDHPSEGSVSSGFAARIPARIPVRFRNAGSKSGGETARASGEEERGDQAQ